MAEGFTLLAAADRGWAIGKDGRMLVQIPKERQLFLQETRGGTVVMGRKTYDSLPGHQPLFARENVVLSADPCFSPKGVKVFRSFREALAYLRTLPAEKVFIAGGESIFRQFLPYCGRADITAVDYRYDGDRFLAALDRDPCWRLQAESEEETYFDLPFTFRRYIRICSDATVPEDGSPGSCSRT